MYHRILNFAQIPYSKNASRLIIRTGSLLSDNNDHKMFNTNLYKYLELSELLFARRDDLNWKSLCICNVHIFDPYKFADESNHIWNQINFKHKLQQSHLLAPQAMRVAPLLLVF